jgi:hypothetical protein
MSGPNLSALVQFGVLETAGYAIKFARYCLQ